MPRTGKLTIALCTCLGLLSAAPKFSQAAEPLASINSGLSAAQDRATELMVLQNQLQRQQFQQQQQQFRQQDRQQVVPLQVQRPSVPTIGSNCRTEVFGNTYVKKCR
jgi:hypothetical protein